jgi:hypothetical protein
MPLFDALEIAGLLNITDTASQNYLTELLAYVEEDLKKKGLIYLEAEPNFSIKTIQKDEGEIRNDFEVRHLQDVQFVKIKNRLDTASEETLVSDSDYYFEEFGVSPYPANHIFLICRDLKNHEYLQIQGRWYSGLFADFPKDLKFAIISAVEKIMIGFKNKQALLTSTDGTTTKSVSVGKIKIDKNQGASSLISSNVSSYDFESLITNSAYTKKVLEYTL